MLSRKVFTECRCQWHAKPPNLEDKWLKRSNSHHQVSPTPETTRANPSSGRWNYGRENFREFCRKWRLPRHFWVLLHAVNLRHETDGLLRIFSPEKSDGFGRVWTRELGYQRPARLPLDRRSRFPWKLKIEFLDAFAKLWKATISFMSVRLPFSLSVSPFLWPSVPLSTWKNSAPHWMVMRFYIWELFEKSLYENLSFIKIWQE